MDFNIRSEDLKLNRVKLTFTKNPIEDIPAEVAVQLEKFRDKVTPGMRIAVTAGSRGISNLATIIGAVVKTFQSFGAAPFVIPAMGSHGGATAEGQRGILADYGITEETMGCPILSSMEVVSLGTLPENPVVNLYMDRNAYEADAVFVVNRVKAHTCFHGPNESGIAKMLVIGLGKHAQALAVHAHRSPGLRAYVPAVAREVIASGKILGALGIVEDGYENTSILSGVPADQILEEDHRLLQISKSMMPRLPFDYADVLVVDFFGKNISGTGMDTNIIGKMAIRGEKEDPPYIERTCVLDMTEYGHGNAVGIGLGDIITKRLQEKIDWDVTYENILTSREVQRGFMPVVQPTDKKAIEAAIFTVGYVPLDQLKLARIKDTLHIDEIYVTDALLAELKGDNYEVLERGLTLNYDSEGTLPHL